MQTRIEIILEIKDDYKMKIIHVEMKEYMSKLIENIKLSTKYTIKESLISTSYVERIHQTIAHNKIESFAR